MRANCSGRGTVLEETKQELNQPVDKVLEPSSRDATTRGGVGPQRGPAKHVPVSQRKLALCALLVGAILLAGGSLFRQLSHYFGRPTAKIQATVAQPPAAPTVEYSNDAPSFSANIPCVSASAGDPANVGTCAMPVPFSENEPVDRFEVDLRTGKFIMGQTDLSIPSANIYLTRTYTPQDWLPQSKDYGFGRHSNHPFDIAPLGKTNPYTEMAIVLEDGSWLYMPRISSGTSFADAVFEHTETDSAFYQAIVKWSGNGWKLTSKDGSSIDFPDSYMAKTLADGAPLSMTNNQGQKIQLVRDPQHHLMEILAPGEHWIRFNYDANGHIVHAEDDAQHWAQYQYSGNGMLVQVENSDGRKRLYGYDGELLTSVTDEQGHVLLRNWYESDWIARQQYADGGIWRYGYEYDDPSKTQFANRVTVTGPDGSRSVIEIGDAVSILQKR